MMKKKILASVFLASTMFVLFGCDEDEQIKQAKKAKPEVVNVGVFDDCNVKYVDRGYAELSFYLAKCETANSTTTTTTKNYYVPQGKTRVFRRSTVISEEIQKLQEEKEAAELQEKALSKLSTEEKKSLGLSDLK